MEVNCNKCPITDYCEAYHKAVEDNNNSYHPQEIVRVDYDECPLMRVSGLLQKEEERIAKMHKAMGID